MELSKSVTLQDDKGHDALTLTTLPEGFVKVAYEGVRFTPPAVSLSELDMAVMALRGHSDSER